MRPATSSAVPKPRSCRKNAGIGSPCASASTAAAKYGHGGGHRGGGDRDDGVGGDAGALQLERPGAHHADDARLGGGVVGLAEVAALAGGRADADDAAADARVSRMCVAASRTQVNVPRRCTLMTVSKSSSRHLPQHGVAQHAGVGDEDVEAAEVLDGRGDQLLRGLGGPDGRDDGDGACRPAASIAATAAAAASASTSLTTTDAPWRASSCA